MGKVLIIIGLILLVIGLFLQFGGRIPFVGKLPGDIVWEKGNTRVYIPIATSLLLSLLISIILFLINRFKS